MLDLSSAFDTVNHKFLLEDLSKIGFAGPALNLFRTYIEDRTQSVVINNSFSKPFLLSSGVPQGSVLGPVLFSVYTCTLYELLTRLRVHCHFYADDTLLYISVSNFDDCVSFLQSTFDAIMKWMKSRHLKLNVSKTEVMFIHGNVPSLRKFTLNYLLLGGLKVDIVKSSRCLGVLIDAGLTFVDHISNVIRTCHLQLRNLYAIRRYLNCESLSILVHSMVVTHIDYCNCILLMIPRFQLQRLQKVLNRCARLIFGLPPRTPTSNYLRQLHWLTIEERIEFKVCLLVYKALVFERPKYICEMISPKEVVENSVLTRSCVRSRELEEPRSVNDGLTKSSRSFRYTAPRLFNKLPMNVRNASDVMSFKKALKTHLFQRGLDS